MDEQLWSSAFVSGFGPIDEHHRGLFEGLGTMLAAFRASDGLAAAAASHQLLDATRAHFQWEQARMADTRYPAAAGHAADHATFLDEFQELVSEIARAGVTPRARLWVGRFSDWFRFHTRSQDLALGRHLRLEAEAEAARAAALAAEAALAAGSERQGEARPLPGEAGPLEPGAAPVAA